MTTLRLSIPNSASFGKRILNGLFAALFVLAVVLAGVLVLQHQAFFRPHFFAWGMAGLLFVAVCGGFALVFADEALGEKSYLLISENSFQIGEEAFSLSMLRKVAVVVRGTTAGTTNASGYGNRIVLSTVARQKIVLDFLLKSREELETLKKLLRMWREQGIRLKARGMGLD
ncbi:hypothetical protein GCM10022409_06780 [Hymenobacter glaciei]|uniref:DUF304 domain-containing protein n=1 Tax=Hymenobacter glaciei TaxID=877209 RepID=A0ABP7TF67_9BACT